VTGDPPRVDVGAALRATYVGHATLGIELSGTLLVTDAVLRRHVAFLRWTAPRQPVQQLRSAEAVLVSHLHHDHCDPRSLASLGRDVTLLVPWGTEHFFQRRRFSDVVPMRPGDTRPVGTVRVTATDALHDGRRRPLGPDGVAIGFMVEGGGKRVYFAGDTDLFDGMADLGPMDLALVPVSGWGVTLGPGHLDPVRAAEAVERLRPEVAVPIHWSGLRPFWERARSPHHPTPAPAETFAAEVRRRQLPTSVRILAAGESVSWPL
jgi:L-ascorbate metabolism protein UlaG (beta-lactamase superfamily)